MRFELCIILLFTSTLSVADCEVPVDGLKTVNDLKQTITCLQQEIKALKNNSGQTVTVNTHPNLPKPTISQSAVEDNFQVDLVKCQREQTRIICELLFTGTKEDRNLRLYVSRMQAFDEYSMRYKPQLIKMLDASGSDVERFIVAQIPIPVTIVFNDVPQKVTQFSRMDPYGNLVFRGIAIK